MERAALVSALVCHWHCFWTDESKAIVGIQQSCPSRSSSSSEKEATRRAAQEAPEAPNQSQVAYAASPICLFVGNHRTMVHCLGFRLPQALNLFFFPLQVPLFARQLPFLSRLVSHGRRHWTSLRACRIPASRSCLVSLAAWQPGSLTVRERSFFFLPFTFFLSALLSVGHPDPQTPRLGIRQYVHCSP
jgi:hypothetical protein